MIDRIARWTGETWQANNIYVGGDFTNAKSYKQYDTKRIICGYCESQQDKNNSYCQSCGGALFDDISNRRNALVDMEEEFTYCLNPNGKGFIKTGKLQAR